MNKELKQNKKEKDAFPLDIFSSSFYPKNLQSFMDYEEYKPSRLKEDLKTQKKIEKLNEKLLRKNLNNDKLSKKVIIARKSIIKKNKTKEKENQKRVKKCNSEILTRDPDYKEIYLTIDKFNTNGKKTVVYFIDSFYPLIDGVVAVLDNYATYMQKYYNVVICAPKHKNTCYKTDKYFVLYSDSIYVKTQGYDLAFPQFDPVFSKYISLLKIDLIHIQSPFNMGNYGLNLAKRRKIPSISTFHSQFKQNFYNAVKNETIAQWLTQIVMGVYKKTTYTATMNTFSAGVMREYGLNKNVEIVPNATNLSKKEFSEEVENKILQKHKINKKIFNIIFIGRFVEVKNVYFILECLSDLVKINKNFNFIFLGYGPEQGKMQKYCKENGLENLVKFTGKIDNLDEKAILIKNSKLLFFPSVYDTDGIVKIECACYCVPTLCIENTGVSCNMVDNKNGFIEKYDKYSFVKRLDYLINNVDFVEKIGKNANLDLYISWKGACEILNKLYEKALKNKNLKSKKVQNNKKQIKI